MKKHSSLTPLPEGRKYPGRDTVCGKLSFTKIEGKAPAGDVFMRYLLRLPEFEEERMQKANRLFRKCAELFFHSSLEETKKSAAPLFARLEWEPIQEGETLGLDLYYDLAPFEKQQKKFFGRILLLENGTLFSFKKKTADSPEEKKPVRLSHRSLFRGFFKKKSPKPS